MGGFNQWFKLKSRPCLPYFAAQQKQGVQKSCIQLLTTHLILKRWMVLPASKKSLVISLIGVASIQVSGYDPKSKNRCAPRGQGCHASHSKGVVLGSGSSRSQREDINMY